ncbi:MAG: hypothetical protein BHW33_01420 [Firmicutes bacterium CAG:137_57_8]|nr:MAG: hypothetical protein BHW33_01420 [Firmicutes bacterium CAG:137_57_8]
MAKLYFKYGAMGSSKTAQALITKYNYEENDLKVWLIKPIGLEASVEIVAPSEDVYACFRDRQLGHCDVIIVDECQFLEPEQVDQLRAIVDDYNLPVMCFGLRTDFQCHLFAGSRRLMEVADSILEIKTICDCGAKATVNARIDGEGHIVTQGQQLLLGGNDSYIAMCHKCWIRGIRERRKIKLHGNGESIDL